MIAEPNAIGRKIEGSRPAQPWSWPAVAQRTKLWAPKTMLCTLEHPTQGSEQRALCCTSLLLHALSLPALVGRLSAPTCTASNSVYVFDGAAVCRRRGQFEVSDTGSTSGPSEPPPALAKPPKRFPQQVQKMTTPSTAAAGGNSQSSSKGSAGENGVAGATRTVKYLRRPPARFL